MSKKSTTYRVTVQDQEGNFTVTEGVEDPPLKGDSFEYEHREVRIGQVTKVERIETDRDGVVTVSNVPTLGDTHHSFDDGQPDVTDDIPDPAELADNSLGS